MNIWRGRKRTNAKKLNLVCLEKSQNLKGTVTKVQCGWQVDKSAYVWRIPTVVNWSECCLLPSSLPPCSLGEGGGEKECSVSEAYQSAESKTLKHILPSPPGTGHAAST